jgi:beta-galactosidase
LLAVDKQSIAANGKDVLHVTAQLTDKKGNPVKTTEQMLKFNIDGEYRLLGIDNGNVKNVSPYQSKEIMTYQGRCMLMLQSTEKTSVLNISAETSELQSNKLTINIK